MIFIVKDYFEGSSSITKTYTEDMIGFKITNDHDITGLTFTINGLTIPVRAMESFHANFEPYKSLTINTTVPYRATILTLFGEIVSDIISPNNVTNLTASNITSTSLTLTWTSSISSDISSYDVYQGDILMGNTVANRFDVTNLSYSTLYRFTVKAKDNSGNTSSGTTINVTTTSTSIGQVADSLVLNLDFSNKNGTTSNTITDTTNNINATLVNVTHDGVNDGYVTNKGLRLQTNDYITVPTNTSVLNSMINMLDGLTIEITSYDTNGILYRTTSDNKGNINSSIGQVNYQYISNDQTKKGTYKQYSNFNEPETNVSKNTANILNPNGSNAINTIVTRYNVDGTVEMFINGARSQQASTPPSDFSSLVNFMTEAPLDIRRDITGTNTAPMTIVNFSIYNRPLTQAEILQNYNYYKESETLQNVTAQPQSISLQPGDSQMLAVNASPSKYSSLLHTTFESGNTGFVTVDANGVLTGLNAGETQVTATSTYEGQTFTNYVTVTVGGTQIPPPTSTRIISGMSINRKTNSLTVGENYAAMATALSTELPFDVFNDNIVTWESSNPSICKVNYGVLEGVSAGTATITAYDGSKTYSKNFTVTVTNPTPVTITSEQTYAVVLADYSISSNNTDSLNTTNGIQNAINYASTNGYKKIVFPLGTYLVNPTVRTIILPSDIVVDFSGATINIEPSSMTTTGYLMFSMESISNTKIINAKIYGEADSTSVANSVESCLTISIKDCYNSGLESCTVSKSPGFNIITENKLVKPGTTGYSISKNNFEVGNIDSNGIVDNTITANHFRSANFINISGLGNYYMIGYNQGYYGYNHLRSRLYSIHFYDSSYAYISSQMYNLQFYNYDKPANATYAKIVIYQEAAPTTQDADFNAVAFIRTVGMPRKCFIKNCTIENNFSTGIAMCGGEGWIIEGNTFSNNRGRMPGCDIDWEDGWENMIGDIVKNNTFNSGIGVIFSAGTSLTTFNNTFNKSTLIAWGRTQNYRVFSNSFNGKGTQAIDLNTQAESYFARNILNGATYTTKVHHSGASYKVHALENTVV